MSWTDQSKRATRAALMMYRGSHEDDTDAKTDVQDLITNLLHVLRESGHDAEAVLGDALDTFREEADEILERAANELRLRAAVEANLSKAKAALNDMLAAWMDAESCGLSPMFEEYPAWMPSLDEAVLDLMGTSVEWTGLGGAREPEPVTQEGTLYETALVVSHYAKSEEEARQLSYRVGDVIFEREDVVEVKSIGQTPQTPQAPVVEQEGKPTAAQLTTALRMLREVSVNDGDVVTLFSFQLQAPAASSYARFIDHQADDYLLISGVADKDGAERTWLSAVAPDGAVRAGFELN